MHALHMGAFMVEIVRHAAPQGRIGYPMGRIRSGGGIAACQFMLALGAGLDPFQPARNRKINRLMVADLEMQEGVVFNRPPIAPVKGIRADEIDGSGNRAARTIGSIPCAVPPRPWTSTTA